MRRRSSPHGAQARTPGWQCAAKFPQLGAAAKQFQLPSNQDAKVDPRVPDVKRIKMINYDFAKYGKGAERRRLLERWEKEVNSVAN